MAILFLTETDMLTQHELQTLVNAVGEHLFKAHRGAVPVPNRGTVVVFSNDGHFKEPRGQAAIATARRLLEVEGFTLGPVVTTEDQYSWLFEAVPAEADWAKALELATAAVWEGWAAPRNLGGPESGSDDGFASYQRSVAEAACDRFSADAHLPMRRDRAGHRAGELVARLHADAEAQSTSTLTEG